MNRETKSKKPKLEIVMVSYKDHHWFDDDLTAEQIVEADVNGEQSIVLTDIGILMRETKNYLVISSHKEERNFPPSDDPDHMTRKSIYTGTSRILKCSIVSIHRWYV